MSESIKVLHFSPHNERDGIAKYQEQYVKALDAQGKIINEFFRVSPLHFRLQTASEREQVLVELAEKLKDFDIFHIQHEFGLFVDDNFKKIMDVASQSGVKIVITVHLSPNFTIQPVRLHGLGPHSAVKYLREKRHHKDQISWHIEPLRKADLVIAHNDTTINSLINFGIDKDRIAKLIHPVQEFTSFKKTSYIHNNLHVVSGDIVFATIGMLHRYKGVMEAVRALKFLPDNYKLAILGGMNPFSDEVKIYNKICDLIDSLGLQSRVFITGFVEDDNDLNSYIRECDICVFPYDGFYYANLSSGSINLALANHRAVIAYPTNSFRELSLSSDGAVLLTDTFAYYELARLLKSINIKDQQKLSEKYASKMAWSKVAKDLMGLYQGLTK